MSSEEDAQEAIGALNGKPVDGREIRVEKAKPQAARGPDRGRRGGGGRRPSW
jgi:RNA recognition motif-containing protein